MVSQYFYNFKVMFPVKFACLDFSEDHNLKFEKLTLQFLQ